MESNFHSTVLQRPPGPHDYDEDDDRRRRDALPSGTTSGGAQASGHGPPPRHSFNLRSPTQAEFHHAPTFSASPSSSANTGPRSILHNPFMSPTAASSPLPPPGSAPPGPAGVSSNLQAPPRSPLHAPPVFYPQDIREPAREKSAGSFYDPTTDTTTRKERRVSDAGSWHNATQTSPSKVMTTRPLEEISVPVRFVIRPGLPNASSQSQATLQRIPCHHHTLTSSFSCIRAIQFS